MSADIDRNKEKQHITRILQPTTILFMAKKIFVFFSKIFVIFGTVRRPPGEK